MNYRFKGQSGHSGPGFQIEYEALDCHSTSNGTSDPCQSVCRDYNDPSGTLLSPYYPAPYPGNTDCTYTISLSNGFYITLSILIFELYEPLLANEDVHLEIRDGRSEEYPLIGKFGGTSLPASIKSTLNHMWIRLIDEAVYKSLDKGK